VKALVFERNLARFAAARVTAVVAGSGRGAGIGPLRLTDLDPPALPGPGWQRVRPTLAGICGSDLATLDGKSSRYFEELVSFPFVPGHEVVGVVEGEPSGRVTDVPAGDATLAPGTRVVVEPVIGCIPRAITPPCPACGEGRTGGCERVAFGHLAPGLQIGYCTDTGGGWSGAGLVAHRSQLHLVPDTLSDDDAVMVEPTACAVHAALDAEVDAGDVVAVLGAGTLGLATIAALRSLTTPGTLLAGAKHPHQQRLAAELGADGVVSPEQLPRAVRRQSGSLANGPQLTGGADIVVDCVGSAESLRQSLAMVRPRGRVVLVGMPGLVHVDLAPLWHREVALTGAYAYGTELIGGTMRRTFDIAMEVVAAQRLGRLVSARYPLERYEEAVAHAGAAGRRGAVKIVFDLDARLARATARHGAPSAPGTRTSRTRKGPTP
jgi:threonine dehydrogenase-like Zn-dependent dehydrogenase